MMVFFQAPTTLVMIPAMDMAMAANGPAFFFVRALNLSNFVRM
jgi:hypothetical protein